VTVVTVFDPQYLAKKLLVRGIDYLETDKPLKILETIPQAEL
jgi:hypothetical protein